MESSSTVAPCWWPGPNPRSCRSDASRPMGRPLRLVWRFVVSSSSAARPLQPGSTDSRISCDIDSDGTYPIDWLVYRVTGVKVEGGPGDPEVVRGDLLGRDLVSLIEELDRRIGPMPFDPKRHLDGGGGRETTGGVASNPAAVAAAGTGESSAPTCRRHREDRCSDRLDRSIRPAARFADRPGPGATADRPTRTSASASRRRSRNAGPSAARGRRRSHGSPASPAAASRRFDASWEGRSDGRNRWKRASRLSPT